MKKKKQIPTHIECEFHIILNKMSCGIYFNDTATLRNVYQKDISCVHWLAWQTNYSIWKRYKIPILKKSNVMVVPLVSVWLIMI